MASSSYKFLNCSKAQMCLFKILHIISSIPPFKQEPSSSHVDDRSESFPNNNKGIGIDLNLRFCSVAESGGESESSVIDQSNNEEDEEAIRDKSVEVSEDRDTQVQSFKVENNEDGDVESESEEDREGNEGEEVKTVSCGDSDCIDLLIEAAKVLSKREELKSEKASEAEAVVVTSKRMRNRALPYRFRDSVVEPLKRAQRPSSTSHAKKRRLLRS